MFQLWRPIAFCKARQIWHNCAMPSGWLLSQEKFSHGFERHSGARLLWDQCSCLLSWGWQDSFRFMVWSSRNFHLRKIYTFLVKRFYCKSLILRTDSRTTLTGNPPPLPDRVYPQGPFCWGQSIGSPFSLPSSFSSQGHRSKATPDVG